MANQKLVDGWNDTAIPGVAILADDDVPKRVSVRGDTENSALETELAKFGARIVSHDLWGGAEGEDESVCPLEAIE